MPKQDVSVELFYDGTWHDIAAADDVFADTPITIKRGQSDEATQLRPASIAMSLANDDDMYRTSNPLSPLYGKAGRNTPTRVLVDSSIRGTAEASSWSPDQTKDFRQSPPRGKAWVDLEAGGLLQRIGSWTEPLRSPFHQYNADLSTSVGYWPMEDPRGARTLYTPTSGAISGTLRGIEFESQTRFAGSAPTLVFPNNPNTLARGLFVPGDPASTAGWQLSFTVNFGSIGTTGDFYEFINWNTGNGTFYSLSWVDGDDLTLLVDNGTTLINHAFSVGGVSNWNKWQKFVVRATYSGGTTTISIYWMTEDSDVFAGAYSDTFSGVTSSLADWQVQSGGAFNDVSFGHLVGTSGTADSFLSQSRVDAFKGYAGENAADRFDRLCTLKNIDFTIIGLHADSFIMGPQPVDTFPNLLKEIITTEDGLVFDAIDDIALIFVLRAARYNQTPTLELVPTDLPGLPREITDNLGTHNIVTASQRNGGEYTATDGTSPMGTQPPPDGVGEERQTVDVNVNDESELPQIANWWLRRGTVNLPRFPQVSVDLGAKPSLVSDVETVEIGSVITITGFREYVLRLIVLGWVEVIGTHTRIITFTCVPDQQFQIGEYDDVARYDSATTTLAVGMTTSQTTVRIGTTNRLETWSTTAVPYPVVFGGELATVTAMTGTSADILGTETFESGLNDFSPSGCTLVQSSAQAHAGTFSALATVTGSPTSATALKDFSKSPFVVPGESYIYRLWVRSPSSLGDVRASIGWYDANGGFLSKSDAGTSLAADTWVQREVVADAPDDAVFARYGLLIGSSPTAGTQVYIDDSRFFSTTSLYQTATLTRSVNGIVKTHTGGEQFHVANPARWGL